mmetsp:Transcript_35189/g.84052  ORF Transcript_35189/g.84052 Transcript_35189/m.84052 type:complete len:204 (+) Transcript_35189:693-1304(+)
MPTQRETSLTFAPVASQSAEIELIELTRWARKAFATSLLSSELQRFVVRICSLGTQLAYTPASFSAAAIPSGVCTPPINTRSGDIKSGMAVPSARNSGLLSTWNFNPRSLQSSTRLTACAVRTGTVLFSTTILSLSLTSAILRAQSSQFLTFAARPAPIPMVFVGVFTEMKTMSAFLISASMSVEKKRFFPRHWATTSGRPGS